MPVLGRPLGHRNRHRSRGQSLVEFAMVLPIFMLILSGILDFGFLLYSRMGVINAAREGARAAVMVSDYSTIPSVASGAAISAAAGGGLTVLGADTICLQTSVSVSSPATIDCAVAKTGDSASVTVHYVYHTFFPLAFGSTFDLSSTVQMVIE
jgi:Flp pilus assembly protein TadG